MAAGRTGATGQNVLVAVATASVGARAPATTHIRSTESRAAV